MIIDTLKSASLFKFMSQANDDILAFSKTWNYTEEGADYDFANRTISRWFNPLAVKEYTLSRIYPNRDKCQDRPEYCLWLHCSNYLGITLINTLYNDRKDVSIEDIGGGMGWLFLYLNQKGFNNFHNWDDFSQLSREASQEFIDYCKLKCEINNPDFVPIISNNVGVPASYFRNKKDLDKSELIIFYTNRALEKVAAVELPIRGFKFLCRDMDDLAVAYCREDKYEEFKNKLSNYEVKND